MFCAVDSETSSEDSRSQSRTLSLTSPSPTNSSERLSTTRPVQLQDENLLFFLFPF